MFTSCEILKDFYNFETIQYTLNAGELHIINYAFPT